MLERVRVIAAVVCGVLACGVVGAQTTTPTGPVEMKPVSEAPKGAPSAPSEGAAGAKPEASKGEKAGDADGARTLLDLEYARPDGQPVKLDLYLPAKEKTGGKAAPVLIWIHGGGWMAGSKAQCPAKGMVKDGFAVASVEYRFTDRAPFPAQIHDCKAAVRYLRAHAKEYNLDPEKFGCWGASAGGHLVALLGTTCGNAACEGAELGNAEQSSAVQCVCDWFGPTDFTEYKAESADVAPMLVKLFGGKMSEKQELVRLASPALHVRAPERHAERGGTQERHAELGGTQKIPPFLIVQGDKDPLVPWEQSKELAEKLKEAGVAAELVIVEGAGHGFGREAAREAKRVREFFLTQLKGKAVEGGEKDGGKKEEGKGG